MGENVETFNKIKKHDNENETRTDAGIGDKGKQITVKGVIHSDSFFQRVVIEGVPGLGVSKKVHIRGGEGWLREGTGNE